MSGLEKLGIQSSVSQEYAQYAEQGRQRSNSVQSTLELFDPVIEKLEALAAQIQAMGDRVNGGGLRGVEPVEKNPTKTPAALLQSARHRLDRTKQAADMIERELRAFSEGLWG